ncbi:TPA: DUF5417 domain-containing protein [Enterobacter hormaechei subsp. xiangfangensis]|nr:DUF5417 domain-containing protein [Enterobacter hormaechei subsp. xiangfangensis]
MKLTRMTTGDLDRYYENSLTHRKMRGRTVYFIIENGTEAELNAIENLLYAKGWHSDGCPCYDDGFGCGWWIDFEEVENFRADYKVAKAGVKAYLEQQEIEAERAAEPARRQAEFFGMADHKQALQIEAAHAEALEEDETRAFMLIAEFGAPEPEEEPEEPEMVAMWDRLEDLHGRYIVPDLAVDERGVIGRWSESGRDHSMRLYCGDNIKEAYDSAYQANEDQIASWQHQQASEQAAEMACERFHEEGHGWSAFQLEDEERWRGRA